MVTYSDAEDEVLETVKHAKFSSQENQDMPPPNKEPSQEEEDYDYQEESKRMELINPANTSNNRHLDEEQG